MEAGNEVQRIRTLGDARHVLHRAVSARVIALHAEAAVDIAPFHLPVVVQEVVERLELVEVLDGLVRVLDVVDVVEKPDVVIVAAFQFMYELVRLSLQRLVRLGRLARDELVVLREDTSDPQRGWALLEGIIAIFFATL